MARGEAVVYKIAGAAEWAAAEVAGRFTGSAVDHADGFIHFSTASQVMDTAAKHFRGLENLLLIAINAAALGDKLVYEPSRGGALFPHLYGVLPINAVHWVKPLALRADGTHHFPDELLTAVHDGGRP